MGLAGRLDWADPVGRAALVGRLRTARGNAELDGAATPALRRPIRTGGP